jgi:hypothetical protein
MRPIRRSSVARWSTLAASLTAVVLLFALFLLGLHKAGFLPLTKSSPTDAVLAAALALVGGLVASAVSVVGLILQHSAAERNAVLQEEAEDRLTLETTLRASALLATADGKAAAPIQQAAALYCLVGLRQEDVALDLLFALMDAGSLDPIMGSGILESVFQSANRLAHHEAISRLGDRAETMVVSEGVALPPSLSANPMRFEAYVRRLLPDLLGGLEPRLRAWAATPTASVQ